ncbi:MAG: hypothetical protein QF890_07110 [Myxococcota bacterium]|nr:hypothetical protein [bacterium]MDP6073658.1 hypothetical protein [Myxococcota bacterium]MDP6242049.1 hypothetical protein [Myxococcota bacterium]MDP7074168.1 hypothetical protein [Myxococcota bacterium]MDP7299825.1 hypothetical protein [Myxococcota bacterium]
MPIRSLAIAIFLVATPAAADVRIALLPISVHASGEESGYLQSGLSEMIAARLDQYNGVIVVNTASEAGPSSGTVAAREAGRAVGADFVLYGAFTRFGDGASLDMRCARVEGSDGEDQAAARRIFIQSGNLAEIIPQLDTLAQKVARYAFGAGGEAPQVPGTNDGTAQHAATGPSEKAFEALSDRVKAIERALFPPVASGESPAMGPSGEDGEGGLVR